MKIQLILPVALLASLTPLQAHASSSLAENNKVEALTRKREAPLPAALLDGETNHQQQEEVKLTDEEELFLRYLQTEISTSYSYAPSAAPTVAVTNSPTKSPVKAPTRAPTKSPVKAPSRAPTETPSTADTNSPTKAPSTTTTSAPSVSESCKDSGSKFLLASGTTGRLRKRSCTWVGKSTVANTAKRCSYNGVNSHCPNTCGACATYQCADSEKRFVKWGKNDKPRSCLWVGRKAALLSKRCGIKGFTATCRKTCSYSGNGLSC